MGINNLHAVILAGGSGTRFWPASRQSRPKQFLNLIGKESLLRQTVRRITPKVPAGNIWIVANRRYRKEIKRHTAGFGVRASQVLWEPSAKNTAPAILWAAARIHAVNPSAVMAVFPSDHLIANRAKFLRLLEKAAGLARQEYLVTFGIVPTRAETGFGYLKTKQDKNVLHVEKFIEKPNFVKAKQFLKNGGYLWNSGMFVWKAEVILRAFKKYLPSIYAGVGGADRQDPIQKIWDRLPSISVDYGILEKASNVVAVSAAGIGWSDLGSWEALFEILPKDKAGNTMRGNVVSLDCRDTLIWAHQRLVAAIGLNDLVVIDTSDALLICPKHLSQDVKNLAALFKQKNRSEQ